MASDRLGAMAGSWALGALVFAILASLGGVNTGATEHQARPGVATLLATPIALRVEPPGRSQVTGTPSVTPSPALPDLTIDELAVAVDPLAYCRQGPLGTWLVVSNAGDAAAGTVKTRVAGISHELPDLPSGGTVRLWFVRYVSGDEAETVAEVDWDNRVPEQDEGNNVVRARLPLPTAPPTCPPTASPTPPTGTPPALPDLVPWFSYSWGCSCMPCTQRPRGAVWIGNRGKASAAPADNVIDFYSVHELLESPRLDPGGGVWRGIPSISIGAVADVRQVVAESNEANNVGEGYAPTYSPPPPCTATASRTRSPTPVSASATPTAAPRWHLYLAWCGKGTRTGGG